MVVTCRLSPLNALFHELEDELKRKNRNQILFEVIIYCLIAKLFVVLVYLRYITIRYQMKNKRLRFDLIDCTCQNNRQFILMQIRTNKILFGNWFDRAVLDIRLIKVGLYYQSEHEKVAKYKIKMPKSTKEVN